MLQQVLSGGKAKNVHGILPAMFGAAASRPQLQPGLFALFVSLRKLSWQQGMDAQLSVAEAAACHAKTAIYVLCGAGVPGMVDVRTWRAMIAPWMLLLGFYCCDLGRWLQRWQQGQLQVLQQPDSTIACDGAAARLQLMQTLQIVMTGISEFCRGNGGLGEMGFLWEDGETARTSGKCNSACRGCYGSGGISSRPGIAGAEFVDRWQQWQHCAVVAAAADGQQQWSHSAAAAASGIAEAAAVLSADAATAAASQQSVSVLSGEQQPSRQQQVLVPAYGSLLEEISLMRYEVCSSYHYVSSMVHKTHKHIKQLQGSTTLETSGPQQRSSHGSSRTGSDSDDWSDEEHVDCERERDQVFAAAQRRVKVTSTIQSSMQACLEFEGFSQLSKLLQEVGEKICAKLPVPWMCNNPHCTSTAGASELQLVGGKACVCGVCRVAR